MEVIIGDIVFEETIEVPIIRGIDGLPGATLELRISEGFIQWKPVDEDVWTNLIAVLDLIPAISQFTGTALDVTISQNALTELFLEKINKDGSNSDIKTITFNIVEGALTNVGDVRYNPDERGLEIKLSANVSQLIGQEALKEVKNGDTVPLTDGMIVYVSDAVGGNIIVKRVDITDQDQAQRVWGMVTEPIAVNQKGFVTTRGVVKGVYTDNWPEGTELWLSGLGGYTNVMPTAPTPKVFIGIVTRTSEMVGDIYFNPRPIARLSKLSDVLDNNWVDKMVPRLNQANGRFEAFSLSHIDSSNVKFTPEGGLAIRVLNGTGTASVKGTLVSASTTADNQFVLQSNEFDTFGIVYESGIANGQYCWVVVSGVADVLFQNGSAPTRGYVAISAPTDGRAVTIAVPSTNPTVGEHFKEIGHCMETKIAGIDVFARCVLHFN